MTGMRKVAAMFGGAAALALTVGFGGVAVDHITSAVAATTPSVNGTPALSSTGSGSHDHILASGCIIGLKPC